MTQVPTEIFCQFDIRGTASGDAPQLTPAVARLVGQAYGTYGQRTGELAQVFVGGDNRLTTPPLVEAIIEGLVSTGLNVSALGKAMMPTVSFASAAHPHAGGIMVTGSHWPTDYNGIKLVRGAHALSGDQILALLQIIEADDFSVGEGERRQDFGMARKHLAVAKSKVKLGGRKIKVVLDAGNGLSGSLFAPLVRALGVEVIPLFCDPDGTFPHHLPDPDLSQELQAAVVAHGADFGIIFDGDADALGVIDERGHRVAADHLLALLARDLLIRLPGAVVGGEFWASPVLVETIRAGHGMLLSASIGKDTWRGGGILLGGDSVGHLFIGENYYGFEDAPLAVLKLLELFSTTDQSFSQLIDELSNDDAK